MTGSSGCTFTRHFMVNYFLSIRVQEHVGAVFFSFPFFFFSFFSFLLLFDSPKADNSPLEESRNARTTDSAF